jgi:hypothetical protein
MLISEGWRTGSDCLMFPFGVLRRERRGWLPRAFYSTRAVTIPGQEDDWWSISIC